MTLERDLKKMRGIFGYNSKEVRKKIMELQDQFLAEKEQLEQELIAEKSKNQKLKNALSDMEVKPNPSGTPEEISSTLLEQHLKDTNFLYELRMKLNGEEKFLEEQLTKKIEQKELIQKKIQDTREYLNNLKKELRQ